MESWSVNLCWRCKLSHNNEHFNIRTMDVGLTMRLSCPRNGRKISILFRSLSSPDRLANFSEWFTKICIRVSTVALWLVFVWGGTEGGEFSLANNASRIPLTRNQVRGWQYVPVYCTIILSFKHFILYYYLTEYLWILSFKIVYPLKQFEDIKLHYNSC